jgi:hypothetical protein
MSRERPRSVPAPMLRDDPGLVYKEHVAPRHGEQEWRDYFGRAFSPEQAAMLCSMLFNCGDDWRREWEGCAFGAHQNLVEQVQKIVDNIDDDFAEHRDAIITLKGQMSVVIGNDKLIEGAKTLDVPAFLAKDAGATPALSPALLSKRIDGLVDRLADAERLIARTAKTSRDKKDRVIAEARHRTMIKRIAQLERRVDSLVEQLTESVEKLARLEHGVVA